MSKNNKKSMSIDKQREKYGRILVIETVADLLYTFRTNFGEILRKENMGSYITDDWKTNAELLLNIYLRKSGVEQKAQDMIADLFHLIIDVPFMSNRSQLWNKIIELTKQFKRNYKVLQYFSIVRQILIKNKFTHSLYPLWVLLDYEYCSDGMIAGETDSNILIQHTQLSINGETLELPYCYMSLISNIRKANPNCADTYKAIMKYTDTKGLKFALAYSDDDTIDYLSAIANFCTLSAMTNKFMFEYPAIMPLNCFEEHTKLIQCARGYIPERNLDEAVKNLFTEIPTDIFSRRKYIIADSTFPKISFGLYEVMVDTETGKEAKKVSIENVRVYERRIEKPEQEYFMIFMEYTTLNVKRAISVCIDNIMATVEALNIIDKFAFLVLLGIYGLRDEITPIQIKDERLMSILEDIKNVVSDIEFVSSEHTVNTGVNKYHQIKEVYVEAFVRRLPKGQVASEEAKALAKKYRVDLGDDRTIVSPYIRNKGRGKNE